MTQHFAYPGPGFVHKINLRPLSVNDVTLPADDIIGSAILQDKRAILQVVDISLNEKLQSGRVNFSEDTHPVELFPDLAPDGFLFFSEMSGCAGNSGRRLRFVLIHPAGLGGSPQ